uniref:Uncharacterized protein n=1 Tax=Tanacetum cinerariifolium TaxID=118510 RepID=A0A699KLT3_TANCI|nr:hypothetical protein [Tanacetum cinerariifolium]
MEQYMSKTQGDYESGVTRLAINHDTQFELKGQFLKELYDNTFSGSEHKDTNEHIKKFLEIVDLFHVPKITQDQLVLRAFPHKSFLVWPSPCAPGSGPAWSSSLPPSVSPINTFSDSSLLSDCLSISYGDLSCKEDPAVSHGQPAPQSRWLCPCLALLEAVDIFLIQACLLFMWHACAYFLVVWLELMWMQAVSMQPKLRLKALDELFVQWT